MNRMMAFMFFMLFLAGFALFSLKGMHSTGDAGASASLYEGEWQAKDINGAFIRFMEDGKVNGSGGCNNFFGSFESGPDGSISFGQLGATRKACPGDIMNREQRFFDALAAATHYSIAGRTLTLTLDSGSVLELTLATDTTPSTGQEQE